ncbi:Uncharacterized protein OBRU01_12046 [Operophtera brumata]|uniref:Uncharacterized protein n=1 Tax=Operophtera brumata TaxID=104452 RepID=A0A0L7KYU9_OPEBR|nr:Uncharacterized protein OBRU01_12046 [Operophtera brumata]
MESLELYSGAVKNWTKKTPSNKTDNVVDLTETKRTYPRDISDQSQWQRSHTKDNDDHTELNRTNTRNHADQRAQKPTLYNHKTDWGAFAEYLEEKVELRISLKTEEDIDEATFYITNLIQVAAWRATPSLSCSSQRNNIPLEIRNKLAEKRKQRRKLHSSRSGSDRTEYNRISRELKELITENQNITFQQKLSTLSAHKKDHYSLWKITKNFKRPHIHVPPIRKSLNDPWARSGSEKAELFAKHLSKVFTPNESSMMEFEDEIDTVLNSDQQESSISLRAQRWSMSSQRLEQIVAALMKPVSHYGQSFDRDDSGCENDISDENIVQCDGCKRNLCLLCSNLTSSEARVMGLKGKRTLLYLCPQCREALFQVPKLIKSYDSLREQLDEVKKQISEAFSTRPTSSSVEGAARMAAQAMPVQAALAPRDTSALLEEIVDRERRATNVIIVGVKESDSELGTDRKKHDETVVKKMLFDVSNGCDYLDKVVAVQRLGPRDSGNAKPRPVKVVMRSRENAIWILKNKSRAMNGVRIYDDKTPLQRQELGKLRETLRERVEKGEPDLTIKYVKGIPKIVLQKKN